MSKRGAMDNSDWELWGMVKKTVRPLKKPLARQVSHQARTEDTISADLAPNLADRNGRQNSHNASQKEKSHMASLATAPAGHKTVTPPSKKKIGAKPSPNLWYLEHGHTPTLDRRTARRFNRGQMPIEGHLDLHGYTQDTAYKALKSFLQASSASGQRCVLVITGKGAGILRQAVPGWLNDAVLRPLLLGFRPANSRDGGDGAIYILLKRQRGKK